MFWLLIYYRKLIFYEICASLQPKPAETSKTPDQVFSIKNEQTCILCLLYFRLLSFKKNPSAISLCFTLGKSSLL